MCPCRLSPPPKSQFSKRSSTLGSGRCAVSFLLETFLFFFSWPTYIDHFHLFCRRPEGSTSICFFSPRDLLFPKLFGTESPENVTGEKHLLSVVAPSVPGTYPARTASFTASFLHCLGLLWFVFGTYRQVSHLSLGGWSYRHVPLGMSAALLLNV